jgi:hypothetical protein
MPKWKIILKFWPCQLEIDAFEQQNQESIKAIITKQAADWQATEQQILKKYYYQSKYLHRLQQLLRGNAVEM